MTNAQNDPAIRNTQRDRRWEKDRVWAIEAWRYSRCPAVPEAFVSGPRFDVLPADPNLMNKSENKMRWFALISKKAWRSNQPLRSLWQPGGALYEESVKTRSGKLTKAALRNAYIAYCRLGQYQYVFGNLSVSVSRRNLASWLETSPLFRHSSEYASELLHAADGNPHATRNHRSAANLY